MIQASEETKEEIWLPIKGFEESHLVSNFGNVKSIDRISPLGRKLKGRLMKQSKNGKYMAVSLWGKIEKTLFIHRLVALTFIPNPLGKITVNHIDGNKLNNHVDNLEWATFSENSQHAYDIGLLDHIEMLKGIPGEANPCSKTNSLDILMMECLHKGGFQFRQIAPKFNISESQVARILNRKQWKHLDYSLTGEELKIK